MVPITIVTWHKVEGDLRGKIWDDVVAKMVVQQQRKAKYNEYVHRTSRKKITTITEELKKTCANDKIKRAELWKATRQDRKGRYLNPAAQATGERIDELYDMRPRGEIQEIGSHDILT